MNQLVSWLILIIGILLVLPLIGITQLGVAADWIVALAVIVIGLVKIVKGGKK